MTGLINAIMRFSALNSRKCALWLAILVVFSFSGAAQPSRVEILPSPTGKIILKVSGLIAHYNGRDGEVSFDRAMLEAIGMQSLTTHTYKSSKAHTYRGILMRDLLDYVGAHGKELTLFSLDGYVVSVPIREYRDFDILLAMEMDGKALTVRRRGPTRIIYPLDQQPELGTGKYPKRMVWQLERLQVQ